MFTSASVSSASPDISEQKGQQESAPDCMSPVDEIRLLFQKHNAKIVRNKGRMTELLFQKGDVALSFRDLVKSMAGVPDVKFIAYLGPENGKPCPMILLSEKHYQFLNEKLPDLFKLEMHAAKNVKTAAAGKQHKM
jgi:hypothetical protein